MATKSNSHVKFGNIKTRRHKKRRRQVTPYPTRKIR